MVVVACLAQAYKAATGPCLQSTRKNHSDAYACVFRMGSLPVPSEKNVPSAFSQLIPWLRPAGPSLATLAASECNSQTRRERFFRTGKPVPNSALLATNIASTGGVWEQHGDDGGDVFFARDGLGQVGVALLFRRVCVCNTFNCVAECDVCRKVRKRKTFVGAVGTV